METYGNAGGDSGISAYEIGSDYVSVRFSNTGKVYTYSYSRAGKGHVDQMKILARSGSGLNSYIMRNVKNLFD
ncbi:hypothetical protein ABIB62_004566 [Mucilaginibacter sp. UYP25]|jgi:hypothetical protein|uniref:hypothetical protein n=1 Tax=unclassified Mucilaginibacter TaxID=2617802 RepID=UPI003395A096